MLLAITVVAALTLTGFRLGGIDGAMFVVTLILSALVIVGCVRLARLPHNQDR